MNPKKELLRGLWVMLFLRAQKSMSLLRPLHLQKPGDGLVVVV